MFRRLTKGAAIAAMLVLFAAGCSEEGGGKENAKERLSKDQPTEEMDHSPSIDTINFWLRTWDEPGKLSYVYVQDMTGNYGYYILEGLPVSYCASIDENYAIAYSGTDGIAVTPAPGQDGVYYSGGQCSVYYGRDATTGNYVEFSVGMGQNYFLYDKPMNHLAHLQEAQPYGDSTVEDVEDQEE